jgi:hypothetical protein
MTVPSVPELRELTLDSIVRYPYNVAVVVDGVVYDTMNIPGQTAALYLSQPKFIQFAEEQNVRVGYTYDEVTGIFVAAEIEIVSE